MRDQGDEQTYPDREDDGIHLSDGDASDDGGVQPDEDVPESDLPEVSSADALITSEGLDEPGLDGDPDALDDDADDDLDDINDDGLPEEPPLSRRR